MYIVIRNAGEKDVQVCKDIRGNKLFSNYDDAAKLRDELSEMWTKCDYLVFKLEEA